MSVTSSLEYWLPTIPLLKEGMENGHIAWRKTMYGNKCFSINALILSDIVNINNHTKYANDTRMFHLWERYLDL